MIGVTVAGMVAAMLGGVSAPAGASARTVAVHAGSLPRAGIVNVASLPRATGHPAGTGGVRSIPLLTRPGNGSAGSAPRAAAAGVRSPLLSIAAGTQLTPALKDSDNTSGLTPPDMGVGADATHVVQMVNVVGKIWTNGVAGSAFQLNPFFLAGTDFTSDPWVLFDQESGRWFAGIFDVTTGGENIAVSTTGSPTGSWFIYKPVYGNCPDQGKGGVDTNVLSLGFNVFSGLGCTGGFLGGAVEIFNKAQMIAGASVNFVFTNPQSNWFSMVPAQALSTGMTTQYFAGTTGVSGSTALQRVTSTGVPGVSTVTITNLTNLTVKKYTTPPGAVQPGTGTKLAAGDVRMQHVVQKVIGGATELLMTWTNKCKPAGDTSARDCARVTETNETTPSVLFGKNLATLGAYDFYPAATWNSANDAIVTFGQSSSAIQPRLMASAVSGGGFLAPTVLVTGTNPNTTGRYGDYFAVALDPGGGTPNQNVWAAGEIGGPVNNDWQTAVREINVTP